MATIISNGTGGGLWNAGATWVGGKFYSVKTKFEVHENLSI